MHGDGTWLTTAAFGLLNKRQHQIYENTRMCDVGYLIIDEPEAGEARLQWKPPTAGNEQALEAENTLLLHQDSHGLHCNSG
jgi:hypothetical protein